VKCGCHCADIHKIHHQFFATFTEFKHVDRQQDRSLNLTAFGLILVVSFSALHSSDWPDCLLLSYVTYFAILPNHINMHVNQNATLKMGAVDSFETSENSSTTWGWDPQDASN
jgi:hypothetical protein